MQQEIHFVTGKGGVGKSTIAAAIALKKSQEGKNVLLVELGDHSFFKDFFELAEVKYQPSVLRPQLQVALWTGEACLQEYARHIIKVEALTKLFFENAIMRAFINVAPGLQELAILGKVTSGPRKHGPPLPFDCIVVDAFATGHFLALLRAPQGMAQAIQFGPMGEQSRSIDACLRDPKLCQYHIVTLPEALPIKEAEELMQNLKKDFGISADLIVNKVLEKSVSVESLQEAQKAKSDLGPFASYVEQQMRHQDEVLQKARAFAPQLQITPLFFEANAWPLLEALSRSLR